MHLVHFPLGLIPLLPLLGAAYTGLFGVRLQRRYGEAAIYWPTILLPWISFLITVVAVVQLAGAGHDAALYHKAWSWMAVGSLQVDAAFQMDRLSAVMTLVVTFVGSLIHVYSRGYMKGDPSFWRFFSHLNLFMFAMLTLVLGDNFLVMFVGWEGVGLCSYLLIGFWYREPKNAVAGMKAFIVNRVGDYGFSLGLFLLFWGLALAPALKDAASDDRGAARPTTRRSRRPNPARRPARQSTANAAAETDGPRAHAADQRHLPRGAGDRRGPGAARQHPRPEGARRGPDHRRLPALLRRRDRQVGADPALRLAARRHGRPDAGLGPDPRRDHGHRRRLHGGAVALPLRRLARRR